MATRGQSKYMSHIRARAVKQTPTSNLMHQHDAMIEQAKTNVHKGVRGGDCNRTQCQRSQAWWYNKTMRAFYCGDCAGAINESCLFKDHIVSFGDMIYVNPPSAAMERSEEQWVINVTTADGTVSRHTEFVSEEAAQQWLKSFYMYADLRSDGSAPFHYSELPQKMARIKALIDSMEEVECSVPSTEHSIGADAK